MVVGLLVGIVQGGLIGWSTKKFGNRKVIMFGFVAWTVGMLSFAVAFNEVYFYLGIIPYVLGGVAGPTIQGVMSNKVPADEQGNLQGVLTSMVSLTAIFGTLLYPFLFYVYAAEEAPVYFPGAPFLMGGAFLVIASIVAYVALRRMKDIDEVVDQPEVKHEPVDDGPLKEEEDFEVT